MKPPEKRSETLYTYVTKTNKKFVERKAKSFRSASEYINALIDKARKNDRKSK